MRRGLAVVGAVAAVVVLVLIIYLSTKSSLPPGISNGMIIRVDKSGIYKVEGDKLRYYSWAAYVFAGKPMFIEKKASDVSSIAIGAAMPEK